MIIIYILLTILAIALMIFLHELGHYTAGRLLGFKILDFSIGFGPAIFQFKKNDINYALRAIPLGGACRFYGEDDEPMDAVAFNAQKVWKRIIVVFAGPFMNLVLAYIISLIMIFAFGVQKSTPVITEFSGENTRAELCGVEAGDLIIAVNGVDVTAEEIDLENSLDRCSNQIQNASADGLTLTVKRGDEIKDIYVSDIYSAEEGRNLLGIKMSLELSKADHGFFDSFGAAFAYLKNTTVLTFKTVGGWIAGSVKESPFNGVVGATAVTAKAATLGGFKYLLLSAAMISLSIGLFNLLPIPALDGGRLVFLLIELIFRKPVPRKVEGYVHMVGLALLLGLIVLITYKDIKGLINGDLLGGL